MYSEIFAVFIPLSIVLTSVNTTIIDGAEYYIQNEDNLCMVAGPSGGLIPDKLFVNGTILTGLCQDIPEHQWIIHYKSNRKLIDLQSGAVHKFHAERLFANITGDIVRYFSNLISLSVIDANKGQFNYLIKDGDSNSNDCFYSRGVNETLGKSECNFSNTQQAWHFNLVSELRAPAQNCSSFWNCH